MKRLKQCCFCCVPLDVGCYLIGAFETVPWTVHGLYDVAVLCMVKPQVNDDVENLSQRHNIHVIYTFHLARCAFFVCFGIFIIVITILKRPILLEIGALLEVTLFVMELSFLIICPQLSPVGRFLPNWIALLLWRLYSATVLYSYAKQVDAERIPADIPEQLSNDTLDPDVSFVDSDDDE